MRFRFATLLSLGGLIGLVHLPVASGQGLLIDHRAHVPIARSYEIKDVSIDARVRDQVAEIQVSQTFHNPGSFDLESEFLFPLPSDGVIQNFVLMVDGREIPGKLMPKNEARKIYEDIVRSKKDPALLEYMGLGLYRTSIFPIPAGADRKVTLRYTQLCQRDKNLIEFSYPLATQKFTAKPIQTLQLSARIESLEPIKTVYCPSHDAEIRRPVDREASVRWERHDVVPSSDFRVIYSLEEGSLGATLLSYRPSEGEDGYFMLLASPEVAQPDAAPVAKTVLFVLDRSGSMSGKKIEQARNALKFVLNNLRDGDLFNIVVYDDRVEAFKPELQRFSSNSRAEAIRFVENIQPGGSTNIADALKEGLRQIHDDSRPGYVLFLTDGLPTAGETRETAIAELARSANAHHAHLFAFGVGYDVNARLLDRLSGSNGGTSEYVKPDEDLEAKVGRFYAKMSRPALSDLHITLSGTDVNRTYPRDLPDLFEGGQLVWVGRYRESGKTTIKIEGKVGSDRQIHEFPGDLVSTSSDHRMDFVEKLWAIRRVGFIIDQIDLHGKNKELTDELVSLSTKYGILTPYTSFLADDRVPLHAMRENYRRTEENLMQLGEVSSLAGVQQRAVKGGYQNAQNAIVPADAVALGAQIDRSYAKAAAPATEGRYEFGGTSGRRLSSRAGAGLPGQSHTQLAQNVKQVGGRAFFRKGEQWVESTITPEREANAIVIHQFSDAYFDLARRQTAEANQFLTFEEPVTVVLEGKVYRIERPRGR